MPSKGLYKSFHPYILNKVEKAFVFVEKGKTNIELFVDIKNSITNGVIWEPENPNPWIESLLLQKNPGKHYFRDQVNNAFAQKKGKRVRIATKKFPIRWAGSGGLLVLKDGKGGKYVPLNVRPDDGLYPQHIDANGGLSSKAADWLHPESLGIREILEELIIVSNDKLLIPNKINTKKVSEFEKLLEIKEIKKWHSKVSQKMLGKKFKVENNTLNTITQKKHTALLTVIFKDKVYKTEGLFLFDYDTAAIDMRNIFEIRIDSLENLTIIDGEVRGKDINNTRDRKIVLFSLGQIKKHKNKKMFSATPIMSYKSGKKTKSRKMNNKITTALRMMINST